jgi:hypothetical protein
VKAITLAARQDRAKSENHRLKETECAVQVGAIKDVVENQKSEGASCDAGD